MKNLLVTGMEILTVVLCFCLVLTFTPGAAAQTTFGNITGTVSGCIWRSLGGRAQVTLTNQETDAKLTQNNRLGWAVPVPLTYFPAAIG